MARTIARGLKRGVLVSVRREGRRRARGVFLRVLERRADVTWIEYRDDRNGGLYAAKLDDVRINRVGERRRQAATSVKKNAPIGRAGAHLAYAEAVEADLRRRTVATYKGHTIAREDSGGVYALVAGVPGFEVHGPHCDGGSATLRGAKKLVDESIKRAREKPKGIDAKSQTTKKQRDDRGPLALRRLLSLPARA